MNPMYCNICSDVRHASGNLYAIQKIDDILSRLVEQPNKEESFGKIALEVPHNDLKNHFMCGQCPRFNSSEMKRINNNIREKVVWICLYIQKGEMDKTTARMIKDNLSGYYPMYVDVINRYQAQYTKPEKELLTILNGEEKEIRKDEAE